MKKNKRNDYEKGAMPIPQIIELILGIAVLVVVGVLLFGGYTNAYAAIQNFACQYFNYCGYQDAFTNAVEFSYLRCKIGCTAATTQFPKFSQYCLQSFQDSSGHICDIAASQLPVELNNYISQQPLTKNNFIASVDCIYKGIDGCTAKSHAICIAQTSPSLISDSDTDSSASCPTSTNAAPITDLVLDTTQVGGNTAYIWTDSQGVCIATALGFQCSSLLGFALGGPGGFLTLTPLKNVYFTVLDPNPSWGTIADQNPVTDTPIGPYVEGAPYHWQLYDSTNKFTKDFRVEISPNGNQISVQFNMANLDGTSPTSVSFCAICGDTGKQKVISVDSLLFGIILKGTPGNGEWSFMIKYLGMASTTIKQTHFVINQFYDSSTTPSSNGISVVGSLRDSENNLVSNEPIDVYFSANGGSLTNFCAGLTSQGGTFSCNDNLDHSTCSEVELDFNGDINHNPPLAATTITQKSSGC